MSSEYREAIALTEGTIRLATEQGCVLEFPVKDLQVLGEYTTSNGPELDDHFLVFMQGQEDWIEISFESGDCEALLSALGREVCANITPTLSNSTIEQSRVLWPESLKGKELFEFREVPQNGFVGWIKKFFGIERLSKTISREVQDYFAGQAKERA